MGQTKKNAKSRPDSLSQARPDASKPGQNGFSSGAYREKLQKRLGSVFRGLRAYDWQLDASEAIRRGLDVFVIAEAGAGKTLTFVLPLLEDEEKTSISLVIAPLNPLPIEEHQAKEFENMGLSTLVLKEGASRIVQKFEKGKPRVILTCPEVVFANAEFRDLLALKAFRDNIKIVAFDEAHLIPVWTKTHEKLRKIRSWLPPRTPLLAASSTINILTEHAIFYILSFDPDRRRIVTPPYREDSDNMAASARTMNEDLELPALDFIVNDDLNKGLPIRKTMVFVNHDDHTWKVTDHLQSLLPPSDRDVVQALDALWDASTLRTILEKFRDGRVSVLVVSSANETGVGKDVPDIVRVVQVHAPDSLEP